MVHEVEDRLVLHMQHEVVPSDSWLKCAISRNCGGNGAPSSDPARITARSQRAGPETGAPSTREYFLAPHYTP